MIMGAEATKIIFFENCIYDKMNVNRMKITFLRDRDKKLRNNLVLSRASDNDVIDLSARFHLILLMIKKSLTTSPPARLLSLFLRENQFTSVIPVG